ncbi:hypothetical protein B0A55_01164 [Friedmanniomyces simplex]|uniref:Zn(2)-C6 fungal-type domain-containing protein n=1 Tax=Friedmanniomyces simplex TaxID=329884 RepID=A0A4U0Y5N8_9PEZI|nr:hypothetical protein B0A55_01164 [Friedmanniomyces simplex]
MEPPQTPGVSLGASQEALSADAGEKRKRQPRNSACQACATLKMKCVPGPVVGKCERCHRMGKDCIAAIPKARKRRSLDGDLSASPLRADSSRARGDAPEAGVESTPVTNQYRGARQHQTDLSHTGSRSFTKLLAQGLGIEDSSEDLLRGLDYNYVQTRLTVFRQLTVQFPFYCLRPDASAITMATDRPVTTVAICTVACSAQPDVQARLAQAFRQTVSAKVIVDGERSMDLLQGLLIFLAWHHNYMVKQQIHQMLYLLAGMAADLGLYRQPHRNDELNLAAALEQDRAFLGCYYLCCGLPIMGFDKPSPLRWTDNLRRCAEHLAMSGSHPQDNTLVGIVELVRAVDDLQETLRTGGEAKRPSYIAYVDMQTKATTHRLKALKREHPELAGTLSYAAANIHFYHRILRVGDAPDTATLIQCACAIKEYVDDLLGRPPILLHQIAIVDWTNLLEILILMARVSKPLPNTGGWEAGALSSMLQPEAILDALHAHMAAALTGDPLAPRHEGQLQWFRGVCDNIKKRILQERTGGVGTLLLHDSPYETVHSLGLNGQSAQGRFRPVNEPYGSELPIPRQPEHQGPKAFDSFSLFDGGLLDDSFWNNFLAP